MYRTLHASHGYSLNINYDMKGKWLFGLKLLNAFKSQDHLKTICSGDACKGVCVYLLAWDHICVFFRVNQVALAALGRKAPPASQ